MKKNLLAVLAMAISLLTIVSCNNYREADPYLNAEYTGTEIPANGATITFNVESNVEWEISNTDPWVMKVNPDAGTGNETVTIIFAANTVTQERSSVFTVKSEKLKDPVTLTVKQSACEELLAVEYTPVDIPISGGTATFKVKSNVAWTAACNDACVTKINPEKGTGNADITVTINANSTASVRKATIKVKGGSLPEKTITISQLAGKESFDVEYTPADIPASGGTATFKVKANMAWTAACSDACVTKISPEKGTGDAEVKVTISANDTKNARNATVTVKAGSLPEKTVAISQLAGELPAAAGEITESDATPDRVILNIAKITAAETYKWYKDGVEVQNTESPKYTATASGIYKVAGVNAIGEGAASPDHTITLSGTGKVVSFSDYLGEYTFAADFRYISKTDDVTMPRTYKDTMSDSALAGGKEGEMCFSNAINEYGAFGEYAYIDFAYQNTGKISYKKCAYDYLGGGTHSSFFVPCIIIDKEKVGFVFEMEIELDLTTGKLSFPTTLTHNTLGTAQAYYVIWSWDTKTGDSKGPYSDAFMTNVVATKTTPPAKSFAAEGGRIMKIPVRITPPAGFDPDTIVKVDQIVVKK